MIINTAGRWLLVALAIVGLAFAATAVSAHGTDTTTETPHNGTDAPPYNGTAQEWEVWMEGQMTDHMGPGSVEWMESHMGVTIEAMAHDMATVDSDRDGYGMHGTHGDDTHDDGVTGNGMGGQGHGC